MAVVGSPLERTSDALMPILSIERHTARFAASSCHLSGSRWNSSSALPKLRPYIMAGAHPLVGGAAPTRSPESMWRGAGETAVKVHAAHMTCPAQLSTCNAEVDRRDAELAA